MKISSIKTRKEFDEFADVWYQRTKCLAEYSQNIDNPSVKRLQAAELWVIMLKRMQKIIQKAIKLNTLVDIKHKKGIAIVGEKRSEAMIKNNQP